MGVDVIVFFTGFLLVNETWSLVVFSSLKKFRESRENCPQLSGSHMPDKRFRRLVYFRITLLAGDSLQQFDPKQEHHSSRCSYRVAVIYQRINYLRLKGEHLKRAP